MKAYIVHREYILSETHFWKQIIHISWTWRKCSFCQMQISLSHTSHVIPQCCNFETYCMCLHANHAHHTLPSPTTGTTRRRNACGVIVNQLETLKADNEEEAISVQVLRDCEGLTDILRGMQTLPVSTVTRTTCCAPLNRKVFPAI